MEGRLNLEMRMKMKVKATCKFVCSFSARFYATNIMEMSSFVFKIDLVRKMCKS